MAYIGKRPQDTFPAGNAVTATTIAANAVTASEIAINAVDTSAIADGAVTAAKLAANSVAVTNIPDGLITATQMANGSIGSDQIIDGSITAAKVGVNSVTSTKIAENNITSREILSGTIVSASIANNAILTQHIDDNQITADQIAANTIATSNIADNAVDGTKIASNSILTRHIDDDQITGDQLADAIEVVTSVGVGGGSTNGVVISQGAIKIKNGGSQSYIDLYCETGNAHYLRLQAPAHGDFSGSPTVTLPATAGTIALTSDVKTTEQIQDIAGGMFSSNTETGITATYQDSDGTIDLVVGTLNQDTTGLAATATALATARTIGGTSFDGTANIAVNLAATATALASARTIHGVSFDGTANIDLSEVVQDTVGAMFSSNTETGITATYEDADGTLDLVIGNDSIVSSMLDTNIDIAGTLGVAGGSTNGVAIGQGFVKIKNGGSQSYIDLYCESSNAHYLRLQAPAHSAFSGNPTVTLPSSTGTVALTSDIQTTEELQDLIGAMFSSNTETGITATYQDSDGTIDLVVDTAITITTAAQPNITSLGTLSSLTTSGNATIGGNLTVNGTTTTLSTTNSVISDRLIELGNGTSGSPANDMGIVMERGDSANAFMGFDESTDKFIVGTGTFTGASTGDLTITTGTLVANVEGNVTGNLTGTASAIADNSVTSAKIVNGTIVAADIANNAILTQHIDDNQITADQIADTTITASQIANTTITASQIANATITTTQIAANTIATGNVADNAIDGTKIAQNSILTRHIDDAQVTADQLASSAVTTAKINADAVTAAKLADDAVVTANIVDANVTTAKIADNAITAAKLSIAGNGTSGQAILSDGDGTFSYGSSGKTTEEIQDIVGAMFSSNTETNITATYQDSDGTVDLVVPNTLTDVTELGTLTTLTVDDIKINGTQIGHTSDEDAMSIASNGIVTFTQIPVLPDNSITQAKVADDAVGADQLAASAVVTASIVDDNVTQAKIADDAVGADQLAANSVVSASIVNGSIVSADIAANTIATSNIADNAVDGTKIASNSILTRHIDDNQITGDQIADDIVLSGTGALTMPDGTTGQRPGSAAAGMFRYNTTLGKFEGYTDAWGSIGGGGGSNGFLTDIFDGTTTPATDGSRTAFTMSQAVSEEKFVMVFIDGVYQAHNAYSVSGATLTMADAPVANRVLTVHSISATVSGDGLTINNFSGDGSDTTFTLGINPIHENNTQVYIDGVYQFKNTYAVSGTTLTFSAAPPNGTSIEVMIHGQTTINTFPATGISGLTAVTPVAGDFMMILDATDAALKKADVKDIMATAVSITSAADAVALTFDSSENATFAGNIAAVDLDISGDVDIDGTLEADAITVNGTTLAETISDTVGAMVTSNTESGITVAYQDADNTLDFTIGTLNQNTTGSAATLTTARAIAVDGAVTGTVNFDGSAAVSITTTLANNAVLTQHIDDNQVTTDQIAANTIATSNIADNAIDGTKIAQNSILTRHIDDAQVGTAQLAADAVDGTKIADDAINSEHYAAGSIDNEHIADNAIDSEHYADNSIDALHLNVSGNGSTSQFLRSDGDGTFTWATPTDTNTTYSVGDGGLSQNNFTNADHSKLNGIESSATADQTAAEILTAIKTVDGSGSGLDADLLDGISSASFLRSDTSDTFSTLQGTTLTVDGVLSVRNAIDLADNDILRLGSSDDVELFFDGSNFYMDLNSGGNNFIIRDGTTTRFTFDDAGHFTATGNVTAYSDKRLKENIKPIESAINKVQQISGNTYTRNDLKDTSKSYAGVIAQEIEVVLPEAVNETEDGTKTVDYNSVIALLVESVKELKTEVDDLKKQLDESK